MLKWLKSLIVAKKKAIFAEVKLNIRIMPVRRGELFAHPLEEALKKNGLGEVTGAGTQLTGDNEVEYCGIDLELYDVDAAVAFVCEFMTRCGAPKGSELSFEKDGRSVKMSFGKAEGLAIYINGTDLPDEVYKQNDISVVYDEINQLLGKRGSILDHWDSPRETALYIYGASADEMRKLIAEYVGKHPLCQQSRLVQIA
ncbi:MAG: hypothetical protein FWD53_03385 [Phycisphaerales bacterium]|nr:hypothetical protein [Phycisphaerales bacterium]